MGDYNWTPRSKLARNGGPAWRREGRGIGNPAPPAPAQDFSGVSSRALNPGSSFADGASANEGVQRGSVGPATATPLKSNPLGTGSASPLQKLQP